MHHTSKHSNRLFAAAPLWLVILCLLACKESIAAPVTLLDDSGNTLRLEQPAQRIVSLAPSITEILFAVGAGDRIVGTVNYSDFPPEARQIPQVGGYNQVNFERILSLNPDLIIAWKEGNSAETLEKLGSLNVPVYLTNPSNLDSIANSLRQLGKLTGQESNGEQAADDFERRRKALAERNQGKRSISVFYQAWEDPLYTLGSQHFFSDVLSLCGGRNAFADIEHPSPTISVEAVVVRNPKVMLSGSHHGERSLQDWKRIWDQWPTIDAVRHHQMYLVDQDIYTRASPRAIEAAEDLCQILDKARAEYGG